MHASRAGINPCLAITVRMTGLGPGPARPAQATPEGPGAYCAGAAAGASAGLADVLAVCFLGPPPLSLASAAARSL
jgi:hypothetical protein